MRKSRKQTPEVDDPNRFSIEIIKNGFVVFMPDRLITRDDLKLLLEGIRDLITEYNNVTMEALRAARKPLENTQDTHETTEV